MMISFPCCKINIGLRVLSRRPDGYHDIETVMYPVRGLCDALEIIPAEGDGVEFSSSGLAVDCATGKNLCVRAYEAVRKETGLGGVKIHLHKVVPMGAGLGGGSADAAYVIKGLNEVFALGLDIPAMERLAAGIGSDTAYFIGRPAPAPALAPLPALATGRGEILTPLTAAAPGSPAVQPRLQGKRLVIVKPPESVGTAQAYAGVTPKTHKIPLDELLTQPPTCWRNTIFNDFEPSVFALLPQLGAIKQALYDAGALYASMSGSGSAVYGIFEDRGEVLPPRHDVFVYQEVMR